MLYFDSLVHVTTDGTWFHTRYDASLEHLLTSLQESAPARACVVGIDGYNMPHDFILEVCQRHPDLLIPVAGLNPHTLKTSRDAHKRVSELSGLGFRAVKLHPRLSSFDLNAPQVDWLMEALSKAGLPVFLCTILRGMLRVPSAPPVDLVYNLLNRHPETPTVLLHGGLTDLLAFSDMIRAFPNALLDLSFTLLRYCHSSIDLDLQYVLRRLDQKCTVGSDFPEYLPVEARQRVLELMEGLPLNKVENVLHANLSAILGIQGTA